MKSGREEIQLPKLLDGEVFLKWLKILSNLPIEADAKIQMHFQKLVFASTFTIFTCKCTVKDIFETLFFNEITSLQYATNSKIGSGAGIYL